MSVETPRIIKVAFVGGSTTQQDVLAQSVSFIWKGSFVLPVIVHGINPELKIRQLIDSYYSQNDRSNTKIAFYEAAIRNLIKSQSPLYETEYVKHNYTTIMRGLNASGCDDYEEVMISAYNIYSGETVKYLLSEGFTVYKLNMSDELRHSAFKSSSRHNSELNHNEISELLIGYEEPPADIVNRYKNSYIEVDIKNDLNFDGKALRSIAARIYANIISL